MQDLLMELEGSLENLTVPLADVFAEDSTFGIVEAALQQARGCVVGGDLRWGTMGRGMKSDPRGMCGGRTLTAPHPLPPQTPPVSARHHTPRVGHVPPVLERQGVRAAASPAPYLHLWPGVRGARGDGRRLPPAPAPLSLRHGGAAGVCAGARGAVGGAGR